MHVTSVIGGRSREWVILETELRACGDVVVCTDDGSYGRHGFVTQALKDLLDAGGVDAVYAIGPVPMMRAVSEMTLPYDVETTVSLNAIMVDGTGMCGGCRVTIGGETKYACVDGPEFDAHKVNFQELADRLTTYRSFEQAALAAPEGRRGEGRLRDHRGEGMTEPASPVPAEGPTSAPAKAPLSNKERMTIGRVSMPEQEGEVRAQNFGEVNLGLTYELAMLEAERCIQCPKPFCVDGCPVRVDIPRFIKFLREGDLPSAAESLLGDNALPCVTGRVCPQETPVRGRLHPHQEGRLGRHRLPRAVRGGLGAGRTPTRCPRHEPGRPASGSASWAPARPASPPPASSPARATTSRSSRRSTPRAAC